MFHGQSLDSIRNNYDLMVYSWEYLGFTTNYNKTLDDTPAWGMVINRGFSFADVWIPNVGLMTICSTSGD
jgi:hypothetical protein